VPDDLIFEQLFVAQLMTEMPLELNVSSHPESSDVQL
jgi:hypothetical protein